MHDELQANPIAKGRCAFRMPERSAARSIAIGRRHSCAERGRLGNPGAPVRQACSRSKEARRLYQRSSAVNLPVPPPAL